MIANTQGGVRVTWSAEHRNEDGSLISRQVSVDPPEITCITPGCLIKYLFQALFYALLQNYHSRRVAYAEANKYKKILERYRTGEPSPVTIWQAIHASLKLKCPLCRKYNVDPLLGGKHEKGIG